jgi:AhpD family alkylhydroperoxidase
MKKKEVQQVLLKYEKTYGRIPDWAETVGQIMPELLEPWLGLRSQVMSDGALPRKVKELMLLGINLVRRYPSGVENHLRAAMDAGATQEEIMETIATAVLSSAAPAMYNGPRALKAELEKRKQTSGKDSGVPEGMKKIGRKSRGQFARGGK